MFEFSSDDSDDEPLGQRTISSSALLRFKAEPQIDMDCCPVEWWRAHEGAYPVIATLAMKYLGSPATTVPCERLFSQSGNIVSKKRASLKPNNVNKLVCLNNWLNL